MDPRAEKAAEKIANGIADLFAVLGKKKAVQVLALLVRKLVATLEKEK